MIEHLRARREILSWYSRGEFGIKDEISFCTCIKECKDISEIKAGVDFFDSTLKFPSRSDLKEVKMQLDELDKRSPTSHRIALYILDAEQSKELRDSLAMVKYYSELAEIADEDTEED